MIVAEQSDWLLDQNRNSSQTYHGDPGWTVGGTGPGGGWLSGTTRVDPVPQVETLGGLPAIWGADCWNITTVRYPPNFKRVMGTTPWPGCSENHGINNPLQSPHSGGLLAAMADGSVRFNSQNTALEVLLQLAIRNDGVSPKLPVGRENRKVERGQLISVGPGRLRRGGSLPMDDVRFDFPVLAEGYRIDLHGEYVEDASLASPSLKAVHPLRGINLEGSRITDAGLKNLDGFDQLLALDLDSTKLSNAGLQHLQTLTRLRWLSLRATLVSDEGLENLRGLRQLEWLDLGSTQITDAGLAHLKGMTQLHNLGLDCTQITDAGLEHLQGLTQLARLNISRTQVTDAGLKHLQRLTQLEWLDLGSTQVTDAGLEHLQGLTQLEVLSASGTSVTDTGLAYLRGLPRLRLLWFDETRVTDAGVAELQKALPNLRVYR